MAERVEGAPRGAPLLDQPVPRETRAACTTGQAPAGGERDHVRPALGTAAAFQQRGTEIPETERDIAAAQEQLRLATERYRVGSGTFFELLDAQVAAEQAEADVAQAAADEAAAAADASIEAAANKDVTDEVEAEVRGNLGI